MSAREVAERAVLEDRPDTTSVVALDRPTLIRQLVAALDWDDDSASVNVLSEVLHGMDALGPAVGHQIEEAATRPETVAAAARLLRERGCEAPAHWASVLAGAGLLAAPVDGRRAAERAVLDAAAAFAEVVTQLEIVTDPDLRASLAYGRRVEDAQVAADEVVAAVRAWRGAAPTTEETP